MLCTMGGERRDGGLEGGGARVVSREGFRYLVLACFLTRKEGKFAEQRHGHQLHHSIVFWQHGRLISDLLEWPVKGTVPPVRCL